MEFKYGNVNLITVPVSIYDLCMPSSWPLPNPTTTYLLDEQGHLYSNALVCRKIMQEVRWLRLGRPIGPRYMTGERERTVYKHFDAGKLAPITNESSNNPVL